MSTTIETQPHSRCLDCDEQFASREAARQHLTATARTRDTEHGPKTGSHRTQVVNPTSDESRRHEVASAIDRAVEDALMRLDDAVYREEFTHAELAEGLRHVDLEDAWREYAEESR